MKKLMKKKNNKGFSLVELIVVVLIMGIIAVALAPQVMKWVGTARKNTDENQKATIKSAAQVAVSEYMIKDSIAAGTYKVDSSASGGGAVTAVGSETNSGTKGGKTLAQVLTATLGEFPTPQDGSYFEITVEADTGKVSVAVK
ncbi:MAG: type II secretion system protein [Lachnospiraceae bacterium]